MLLSCSRLKAVTSVSSEAGSDRKSNTCVVIRTPTNVDAIKRPTKYKIQDIIGLKIGDFVF